MSFILDALRKSEHERQRQAAPGIADLRPASPHPPRLPAWSIALGILLLANIVIVAVLVMRYGDSNASGAAKDDPSPASSIATPAATTQSAPAPKAPEQPLGGVSASVFRSEGLNAPAAPKEPVAVEDEPATSPSSTVDAEPEILEPLPTIDEMVARGTTLPPLHLDIHVFVAKPSGRFVFINQRKYREGTQLPEGPVVERITREGVVLTYGGSRFLMPRP
jgi:general secretion pathway protein B